MAGDERARLRTLLNYWIEHNKEHSQEFREWAARVRESGDVESGEDMVEAAREMDRSSEILARTLKRLEEKEG